ncbi:MAG: hypothetical protein DRH04_07055, partial [Deltaproteobacteria bacterium]
CPNTLPVFIDIMDAVFHLHAFPVAGRLKTSAETIERSQKRGTIHNDPNSFYRPAASRRLSKT